MNNRKSPNMAKVRMGMVGGGEGAFIGAVHRMAAALDGEIELDGPCVADGSSEVTKGGDIVVGALEGMLVGALVKTADGTLVGTVDGALVGKLVGAVEDSDVGAPDGSEVISISSYMMDAPFLEASY